MKDWVCSCCNDVREYEHKHQFAERCPWCQARLIQRIQRVLVMGRDDKTKRCQAVIADVREWGLDEAQVRALAKAPARAVQPAQEKPKTKGKR